MTQSCRRHPIGHDESHRRYQHMKKGKILFTNPGIHPHLAENLEKAGFECHFDYKTPKEDLDLQAYTGVVMKSRFNADKAFFDKAPNLKFLARVGVGYEHIDRTYAKSKGIPVLLSPEGSMDAVGEHAIGMILSLFNKLNKADREIRAGQWLREPNRGIELKGKTVGIIGYGNMGQSIAKKLSGFEAKAIAYDKYKTGFGDAFAKEVDLDTLFQESDLISIHIYYNTANHYFINKEFLAKFKKPIYVINTARGLVLNTADLVEAMQASKVLGAGLDVLEYEKQSFETFTSEHLPAPYSYLLAADNVILSPHIAGWTQESKLGHARTLVRKILSL